MTVDGNVRTTSDWDSAFSESATIHGSLYAEYTGATSTGNSDSRCAIMMQDNANITVDGDITAIASQSQSFGIKEKSGTLISKNGDITATGDNGIYGAGTIIAENGSITATGEKQSGIQMQNGLIQASGKITGRSNLRYGILLYAATLQAGGGVDGYSEQNGGIQVDDPDATLISCDDVKADGRISGFYAWDFSEVQIKGQLWGNSRNSVKPEFNAIRFKQTREKDIRARSLYNALTGLSQYYSLNGCTTGWDCMRKYKGSYYIPQWCGSTSTECQSVTDVINGICYMGCAFGCGGSMMCYDPDGDGAGQCRNNCSVDSQCSWQTPKCNTTAGICYCDDEPCCGGATPLRGVNGECLACPGAGESVLMPASEAGKCALCPNAVESTEGDMVTCTDQSVVQPDCREGTCCDSMQKAGFQLCSSSVTEKCFTVAGDTVTYVRNNDEGPMSIDKDLIMPNCNLVTHRRVSVYSNHNMEVKNLTITHNISQSGLSFAENTTAEVKVHGNLYVSVDGSSTAITIDGLGTEKLIVDGSLTAKSRGHGIHTAYGSSLEVGGKTHVTGWVTLQGPSLFKSDVIVEEGANPNGFWRAFTYAEHDDGTTLEIRGDLTVKSRTGTSINLCVKENGGVNIKGDVKTTTSYSGGDCAAFMVNYDCGEYGAIVNIGGSLIAEAKDEGIIVGRGAELFVGGTIVGRSEKDNGITLSNGAIVRSGEGMKAISSLDYGLYLQGYYDKPVRIYGGLYIEGNKQCLIESTNEYAYLNDVQLKQKNSAGCRLFY